MKKFFEYITEAIQGAENSFVNFVSAIAPWLAPISPAYMTYQHAVDTLHFPVWVAMPVSIVVEILGFSAVSTFMAFWFFNRRNKSIGKRAPVGFVIFAFFFYLALIVTSNILLDTFPNAQWAIIAARALFALQTIPAALIVISRAGHKSLLEEIANEKKANKTANDSPNGSLNENNTANDSANKANESEQKTNEPRTYKTLTNTDKYYIVNNDSKRVAADLGVTPRAIQKWRVTIQEEIQQGKL